MKTLVKRAVGWHGKSDAEKASLWKAIELAKYKAKLVLALILSPIPFALQSILSFTGTDKHSQAATSMATYMLGTSANFAIGARTSWRSASAAMPILSVDHP